MKLFFNIDYEIEEEVGKKDVWNGREIELDDTLTMSKVLNPDRFGGHSIDSFGKKFNYEKINWRARAEQLGLCKSTDPKGAEFLIYHPEMLVYCQRDVEIGLKTYNYLIEEWGSWDWAEAYKLEKRVADTITRQEHRGFFFFKERAEAAVKDLDEKMEVIATKVEPLIPTKEPTKALQNKMKFPAKPFLKSGGLSSSMERWFEKWPEAKADWEEGHLKGVWWLGEYWENKEGEGLPKGPLVSEVKATLKDTTHIKEWLVKEGWKPLTYKDRDLTVDTKKVKLSRERFEKVVEKYVEQTLSSPFCEDRCEHLNVAPSKLREKLMKHKMSKPLKVLTNPVFTEGQTKEVCPSLKVMKSVFPYVEDVVYWLTYSHRRNSILGGGLAWEDEEEAEKGYLSQERINIDGRIPTPADTCGASTSRFKHRTTVNIPRATSLYGGEMRDLFGVSEGFYQIGYDFAGLEARIEAAYVHKYPGGAEYAKALVADKPDDLHTLNAIRLGITRDEAKTVKYSLTYGAQPASLAKSMGWSLAKAQRIYNEFWEAAKPLKSLKERLERYWERTGKKYILGIDGREVVVRSKHALLNTLFQSAGVICAKRAMVLHERKLQEKGLSVDFFRDDWENMDFAQQIIAYHDEAQIEASKSLVKFKVFNAEEEAKDWLKASKSDKIFSNIGHSEKNWYVAYSVVGELAVQSAREAGQYYNLAVELDADYAVGRSWRECH